MATRKRCWNIYPCWLWFSWPGSTWGCWAEPKRVTSMSLACSFIGSRAHPWQTMWTGLTMEIGSSTGKKAEKPDLISPHCPWNEATFQGFIKIAHTNVVILISVSGFSAVIWLVRANASGSSQVCFHLWFFLHCTNIIGLERCGMHGECFQRPKVLQISHWRKSVSLVFLIYLMRFFIKVCRWQ